jgi:hypothetical protein
MDHKQLATPSGRRKGVLYPNWNSCLLIERPQKARLKKRLPLVPDSRVGLSQQCLQKSPIRAFVFANWLRVRAVRDNDFRSPVSLFGSG